MSARPPEPVAQAIEILARRHDAVPADAILDYELLSGGNSHITWRLLTGDPARDLVVKIAQPDGPLAPYDVKHEAAMMAQAEAAGVPAPALVGVHHEGDVQFILMRRVEGDSPSLWEVREWLKDRPDTDRIAIGHSLLSTLPCLALASRGPRTQQAIYTDYLGDLVAKVEEAADGVLALPPTIRVVHDWLVSRLPSMEAPTVLCHGDFRLGNAVFDGGDIAALLDWERAMEGHPLHDLGFLCLPGMKIGDHICGVLTQQELADAWLDLTGTPLDLRAAAYFRILAIFGELCLMVRAMARLAQGRGRLTGVRPLPLIGRLHHDLVRAVRSFENDDFTL